MVRVDLREEDVHVVVGATDQVLIPLPTVANLYCYAWVVYTENIYPQYDTAYLAHYVKSDGEYLYAIPISEPHNADARAGDITAFAFDKMEEAEWTGTIRHHDGREEEITVPVMKDTVTGKTVLGDVKRKILCADYADYADYAFKETLTPRTLEDGASWDEAELLTYLSKRGSIWRLTVRKRINMADDKRNNSSQLFRDTLHCRLFLRGGQNELQ